jgi:hypothetical protein
MGDGNSHDQKLEKTKAAVIKTIKAESDELKQVRDQARRYMVAVYGKDWIFMAPETFGNHLIEWIWAIASDEMSFAEDQMEHIEVLAARDREGSDD